MSGVGAGLARPPDPLRDHAAQQRWVDERLVEHGLQRTGPYDRVHRRPWATAARVPTDAGTLWFKAHTPVLAREAPVTRVLAGLRPEVVLDVVDSDDDRCWLLTRDAGAKLRVQVTGPEELDLLVPVLQAYADLQRAAVPEAEALLTAGALDRRSTRVAELLAEALDAPSLGEGMPYGLGPSERARLAGLVPRLAEVAASGSVVPDTLEHSDLHDGNVFAPEDDPGDFRIADLGDCCVGHPFVSLVVLDRSLVARLRVAPDGPELARLHRAYLEPWTDVAPYAELERLAAAVRPLGLLGRGLTWRALVAGVDDPGMAEFADGWPEYARELADALDPVRPGAAPP